MLVRPDIDDDTIRRSLGARYGIDAAALAFLPLGADFDAAAFRVAAADGRTFFLKLRRGSVAETSLTVPRFLADAGVAGVVAPIRAGDGALCVPVAGFAAILYPFVDGLPAHERPVPPEGWAVLGATLRRIHDTALPAGLAAMLPREDLGPERREAVRRVLAGSPPAPADDAARALLDLLAAHRATVSRVVEGAERLAGRLRERDGHSVLCHADLHAANVLVAADGGLHIVDWDAPVMAPRERDLMFVGAGILGVWNRPDETARFLEGYGPPAPDPAAIAFYRLERVVTDIAETCGLLLGGTVGGDNRREAVALLAQLFRPGDVVDIALATLGRIGPAG